MRIEYKDNNVLVDLENDKLMFKGKYGIKIKGFDKSAPKLTVANAKITPQKLSAVDYIQFGAYLVTAVVVSKEITKQAKKFTALKLVQARPFKFK